MAHRPLTSDHRIHRHVVGFWKCVIDQLPGEADADFEGVGAGGGEQAVVEPSAAAEASAARVEGEAGAQERVDVFDGGLWQVGGRFADAERAKVELFRRIGHDAEYQVVAVDLRIDPAPFRVLGHQFRHVGFAGQGGKHGEGAQRGMGGQTVLDRVADGAGWRGGGVACEPPHVVAEIGFAAGGSGICHLQWVDFSRCLRVMMPIWQAATVFFLGGMALVHAADPGKPFAWESLKVAHSLFTAELGMLDSERDEYATSLATQAANEVAAAKASPTSLAGARRMLALALNLSPRNKRSVVLNFQLSKGILPEVAQGSYSPQALARLLLTRSQLLEKQGGEDNKLVARLFVAMAAAMDPKNEDAVYASEVHRLDHGSIDWSALDNPPAKAPDKSPAPTPEKTPEKSPVRTPLPTDRPADHRPPPTRPS